MSGCRIALIRIMHESNSFSCIEAGLSHFTKVGGILVGDEILSHNDRRDEVTGFLRTIESSTENIEAVPFLSASGLAGGNVAPEAVRHLEEILRRALETSGPLDGVLVALHGSMSSADIPDLEGYFLEIIRQEKGPSIPIVCTLDSHAVVTQKMIDLCSVMVAYKTHPHVDIVETGQRAAGILLSILAGKIKPVTGWCKIPMTVPPPDDGMKSGPLKELFDALTGLMSNEGVIDCSLCCSQCWLDVPEQGWAVLAVTDNDYPLATRIAKQLAMRAWELREGLLPVKMLSPQEAVRAAAQTQGHPIVITDSADTVGGGAPGDTTTLLEALIDQREQVHGLILIHIPDHQAVQNITPADVGTSITLEVGGKRDTRFSTPLTVTAEVLCVTDGIIEDVGAFGSRPFVDAGKTVCLGLDNIRLVVTEEIVVGPQPTVFRKVGIEPFDAKIVALKTGVGFKVTYGAVAKGVFRADCPGAASYNLNNYEFTQVPRPLYPLDPDMDWCINQANQ